MAYHLMQMESMPVPNALKDKPRWVTCAAYSAAAVTVVASAITMGIIIGYTYCYIEYRTGFRSGNLTDIANMHIVQRAPDSPEVLANRTINGALLSSVFVTRILNMGHAIMEEELHHGPWPEKLTQT